MSCKCSYELLQQELVIMVRNLSLTSSCAAFPRMNMSDAFHISWEGKMICEDIQTSNEG